MNDIDVIYNQAKAVIISIRKMALSGNYSPGEYATNVDLLVDSIIELANNFQFGCVAEITEMSTRMLAQGDLRNSYDTHPMNYDDFIYHISIFPTQPGVLVNHISGNEQINRLLVDSAIKSRSIINTASLIPTFQMMKALAEEGDISSWSWLTKHVLVDVNNVELAIKSLAYIQTEVVNKNVQSFEFLKEYISGYKPTYFELNFMGIRQNRTRMLDNLKAIGELPCAHNIINISEVDFKTPFGLHALNVEYEFIPNEHYLKHIERHCYPERNGVTTNLITGLYAYQLSHSESLQEMTRIVSPADIVTILSLDGTMSPYGEIKYKREQVTEFLDQTFRLAIKERGDSDLVFKQYRKVVPEKLLLLSKLYKGAVISDALGL